MPLYDYICEECGELFEIQATIADYEKGLEAKCPKCGSIRVQRSLTWVNLMAGKRDASDGGCGCGPGCCG